MKRTTLTEDEIGEYSGQSREVKPVTIATYQILTAKRKGEYAHLALLDALDWGLVVYDEVHLLPAPVFKLTADLQARRRLGLTATLVREDGREGDVFSLIGPKRFDAPWKEIEAQGFISPAECFEVRIDLPDEDRLVYAAAADDERYRLAATAPAKLDVTRALVERHRGESILVIGQYLEQIDELAEALGAPKLTGATPVAERERLYQAFRDGTERVLVVSKVANFSVDLPDATVAIQVSGSFGSRQEEAQRLAACSARRHQACPRASTRSSPATPSTRTSPRTASASWPSRATATRSWMRRASRPDLTARRPPQTTPGIQVAPSERADTSSHERWPEDPYRR